MHRSPHCQASSALTPPLWTAVAASGKPRVDTPTPPLPQEPMHRIPSVVVVTMMPPPVVVKNALPQHQGRAAPLLQRNAPSARGWERHRVGPHTHQLADLDGPPTPGHPARDPQDRGGPGRAALPPPARPDATGRSCPPWGQLRPSAFPEATGKARPGSQTAHP